VAAHLNFVYDDENVLLLDLLVESLILLTTFIFSELSQVMENRRVQLEIDKYHTVSEEASLVQKLSYVKSYARLLRANEGHKAVLLNQTYDLLCLLLVNCLVSDLMVQWVIGLLVLILQITVGKWPEDLGLL